MIRKLTLTLAWATLGLAAATSAQAQLTDQQYGDMQREGFGDAAALVKRMPPEQQKMMMERAAELEKQMGDLTPEQKQLFKASARQKLDEMGIKNLDLTKYKDEKPERKMMRSYVPGAEEEMKKSAPEPQRRRAADEGGDGWNMSDHRELIPEHDSAASWGSEYQVRSVDEGGKVVPAAAKQAKHANTAKFRDGSMKVRSAAKHSANSGPQVID